jgi:hypothetical protein
VQAQEPWQYFDPSLALVPVQLAVQALLLQYSVDPWHEEGPEQSTTQEAAEEQYKVMFWHDALPEHWTSHASWLGQ